MPEVEDGSPIVGLVLLETASGARSCLAEIFVRIHSKVKSILGASQLVKLHATRSGTLTGSGYRKDATEGV